MTSTDLSRVAGLRLFPESHTTPSSGRFLICSHDDAILSGVTRFDSSSDDSLAVMEAIYLCPLEVVEVYRLCAFPSGLDRSLATGPHKF